MRVNASAFPVLRGRRPWHVRKLLDRKPGTSTLAAREVSGPHREGDEPKPMMHGGGPVDAEEIVPLALMKIRVALRPHHRIALQDGADTCTGFRAYPRVHITSSAPSIYSPG